MGSSIRARIALRATESTLRPVTGAIPLSGPGVALSRAIAATFLAVLGPAVRGTRITPVDTRRQSGGERVRGEWVRAPRRAARPAPTDAVVLYLHGSAYVICSPRTHRGLTARLSAYAGLPVFSCDYRLAPRHRFPRASEDVAAAFGWLVDQGFPPERIVVAGDSAGGHLAVDLALQRQREGLPGPGGLVLFSPVYDMSFGLAAEQEQVRPDPMISAANAARLVGLYTAGVEPSHHRLRLAVRGGPALPPVLVQAGGAEMLLANARQLAADAEAAGGTCRLEVWPEQMHVFQALPLLVPEATRALRRAAAFIEDLLDRTAVPASAEVTRASSEVLDAQRGLSVQRDAVAS